MERKRQVRISKLLSYALRHRPDEVGIALDEAGWTDVTGLLAAIESQVGPVTAAELATLVAESGKQRFALSPDGSRIRANQGHSIGVELGLVATEPPEQLFHGTHPGAVDSIRATGLERRGRDHVHLSADRATAAVVGARRGPPVILVIAAREMAAAGHAFALSANGVWLTLAVPPEFIEFPT